MNAEYRKYLEGEIASRRRRIGELDTEKVRVSAEITAYENMLQHMIDAEADAPAAAPRPIRAVPPPAKRPGFQMSPAWVAILRALEARGRSFNAHDLINVAEQQGTKVTVQNARSQIAHYSKPKSGVLRRVQAGRYAFTAKGKELLKEEGPGAGTPKPSNGSAALGQTSSSGLAGEPTTSPNESRSTQAGIFD